MDKFTLNTDFSLLNNLQKSNFIVSFKDIIDEAFENSDNHLRLLGNLLVMQEYVNTLIQGLDVYNKKISFGLEYSINLLWDYLNERIKSSDFEDFANDYYDCMIAYNLGDFSLEIPKEFIEKYFEDSKPDAYELLAVEWTSGLLLQLVSIEGARLDFDEFEGCKKIDFYGIDIMINILQDACIGLTNTTLLSSKIGDLEKAMSQVRQTSLFQNIIKNIQDILKLTIKSDTNEFLLLREKYIESTIIPKEYANKLLEY